MLLRYLKSLFCRHRNLLFMRNIYGDEIFLAGGRRSIHLCRDCGSSVYRRELYPVRPITPAIAKG